MAQTNNMAQNVMGAVLATVIAGILIGYVFPIGLDAFNQADTSSWDSAEADIFGVLGIFLVLTPLGVLAGYVMRSF